jgi:hypothetical protein
MELITSYHYSTISAVRAMIDDYFVYSKIASIKHVSLSRLEAGLVALHCAPERDFVFTSPRRPEVMYHLLR